MRKRTSWIVTLAVILLVAGTVSGPAISQDESNVPKARDVVDRYIEAIGGEEAIRSHTVTVAEGRMEVPSQGMSAELKISAMAPNKMKMEMNIPGIGLMLSGFDGEVGWAMNPMTGPILQEGKELAQTKRQADFYSTLHGENLYTSMVNTGQADFQGNPCWKLELTTPEGDTITEYFNIETGLLDGMSMTQESMVGPMDLKIISSDYREFDGVLVSMKTTVSAGPGMDQILALDSIKFEGVTEADFELPAEIKAMVGGGKAEAKTETEPPAKPEDVKRED